MSRLLARRRGRHAAGRHRHGRTRPAYAALLTVCGHGLCRCLCQEAEWL